MAGENRTVVEKGQRYLVFEYQASSDSTTDDFTEKAGHVFQRVPVQGKGNLFRARTFPRWRDQSRLKWGSSPTVREGSTNTSPCLRAGYGPNLIVAKATRFVIIHHADGLHERITDR